MWRRTKRLINSYLDNLIDKSSTPGTEVRRAAADEIGRLNETEVQALASSKMLERELAEVDLKLTGAVERQRMANERGDSVAASNATSLVAELTGRRDLLERQLAESRSAARRAKSLSSSRRSEGEELATETNLTSMRETLAATGTAFDPSDPAAVIDEMRARINRGSGSRIDMNLADAERELADQTRASRTEQLLEQYRRDLEPGIADASAPAISAPFSQMSKPLAPGAASNPQSGDAKAPDFTAQDDEQPKTLGPAGGPVRPID